MLERAGARPEVPAEDLAAIKGAFRAAWEEQVHAPRARRSPWLASLAAALLLALGGFWWWQSRAPEALVIAARVERAEGASRLAVGDELPAGRVVLADGGHLALRLAAGQALRLERGSRLQLGGGGRLRLEEGALYVDSEGASTDPVRVETTFGLAREVGTRFEVRLLGGAEGLRVRVREGAVAVERGEIAHQVTAGHGLTLAPDGAVEREDVPGHGEPWTWMLEAAPPLTSGRTLAELLTEVARETGWTVRYADAETENAARATRVQGALRHLRPDEVPAVVLAGTSLEGRLADGVLTVARR